MPLVRVAGDTYVLRGSPSTLFHVGEGLYIVDPGHGKKRAKQIRKEISGHSRSGVYAIITHYHSDHHSALSHNIPLDSVAAPRKDAPMITDPYLRTSLTFGMPLSSGDPLLPFTAPSIDVDTLLEPGPYGPLKILPLPGHTLGQIGVETPDGVLYASDSLFGPRVLETYGVPYHFNPCMAEDTLESLLDYAGSIEALVPSHGPIARGDEIRGIVEMNLERVRDAWSRILDILVEPRTVGEVAYLLASGYGVEPSPGMLMLVETAVKGYISCRRDYFEVSSSPRGVLWRTSRS